MAAGKVFQGYSEGKIGFRPTYKFDPGTDDWDTRFVLNIYRVRWPKDVSDHFTFHIFHFTFQPISAIIYFQCT